MVAISLASFPGFTYTLLLFMVAISLRCWYGI